MEWMVELNDLDARQRETLNSVITERGNTHWISGYAGTGKTIVLTHAIEKIALKYKTAKISFITYTHALKDLVGSGLPSQVLDRLQIHTMDNFKNIPGQFDYLFIDEIQDVKKDQIAPSIARAKHVVAAGDHEQSIYLNRSKPSEIESVLGECVRHDLRQIHRLTEPVFEVARTVLPEAKLARGVRPVNEGEPVRLMKFSGREEEAVGVVEEAIRVCETGIPSAILFAKHKDLYEFAKAYSVSRGWGEPPECVKKGPITDYSKFNDYFRRKRSPLQFFGSNNGSLADSDDKKTVYLMTFHSAKGLDFSSVFIPGLRKEFNIGGLPKLRNTPDYELKLRRLLFVAVTRARETLYLSFTGARHPVLGEFSSEYAKAYRPK